MALDLTTARDRIRFAVGDVDDTAVLMQGGGLTVYTQLLTLYGGNEEQAYRAAALALASYYSAQPSSLSVNGKSLGWADRVKTWKDMATGRTAYPFGAGGSGGSGSFSVTPQRDDGYASQSSEYSL